MVAGAHGTYCRRAWSAWSIHNHTHQSQYMMSLYHDVLRTVMSYVCAWCDDPISTEGEGPDLQLRMVRPGPTWSTTREEQMLAFIRN